MSQGDRRSATDIDLSAYALIEPVARWRAARHGSPAPWHVDALAFSYDGRCLFASMGPLIVEIDLADGGTLHEYHPNSWGDGTPGFDHLLPTADGCYLLAGNCWCGDDGGPSLRDYVAFHRRGAERAFGPISPFLQLGRTGSYHDFPEGPWRGVLSNDGAEFAICSREAPYVIDVESGCARVGVDPALPSDVSCLVVIAIGGPWLVGARHGEALVFDRRTWRRCAEVFGTVTSIGALSRDRERLTLAEPGIATVAVPATGDETARLSAPEGDLHPFAVTGDAGRVWWMRPTPPPEEHLPSFACVPDAPVYAQDVLTGETWAFPSGGGDTGGPVAVSPDGTRLARALGTRVLVTATGLPGS